MAFKGNIQDLGLIDVLQLIGQSGKTGIIHVVSDELDAQVFLKDGKLIDVKSDSSDMGMKIGNYLLNKEIITQEELEVLLEKQNKMPVRFGTLLVDEGYITKEQLKNIMGEFLKERFLRVLSVDSGSYDFEQTIIEYNPDEVNPIPLNSILLDLLKDLDEIKLFKSKLKGFDVVYSKVEENFEVVIDDRVSDEEPVIVSGNIIKLNKNSYLVYSNIDGSNNVSDIIDKTALSEHFVLKVIFSLFNSKIIKIADSSKEKIIVKSNIDKKKFLNIALYLGILILLFIYIYSFYELPENLNKNIIFSKYKNTHNLKSEIFTNNLIKIFKIEYPNEPIDLKKLNINYKRKYYEFGGL